MKAIGNYANFIFKKVANEITNKIHGIADISIFCVVLSICYFLAIINYCKTFYRNDNPKDEHVIFFAQSIAVISMYFTILIVKNEKSERTILGYITKFGFFNLCRFQKYYKEIFPMLMHMNENHFAFGYFTSFGYFHLYEYQKNEHGDTSIMTIFLYYFVFPIKTIYMLLIIPGLIRLIIHGNMGFHKCAFDLTDQIIYTFLICVFVTS